MPYTSQQTGVLCVMKKASLHRMVLSEMQIRQRSTKEYVHEQTSKLNSYGCLTNQQFSNDGYDEKKDEVIILPWGYLLWVYDLFPR
jgi:hypothetical protein